MTRRRPAAGAAAFVILLALTGSTGPAAAVGEPSVVLSSSRAALGDVLYVTLDGWSQGTVTVAVCGNDARRGSPDCDLRGATAEGPFAKPGPAIVSLIVGQPPAPCPCVVRVSTPTTDLVRTAPIEIDGLPVATVVGPDRPGDRLRVTATIAAGPRSLLERLRASFGGRAGRTLIVSMTNVGTTPLTQVSLSAAVGRDLQSGEPLPAPPVEPIGPGETRQYRIPVSLSAPSFGTYVVSGTAYVPNGAVRFDATTSTTPVLLLAGGAVLVVLLLVATYRYARRRLAEGRARRVRHRPTPVVFPIPPAPSPPAPIPQLARGPAVPSPRLAAAAVVRPAPVAARALASAMAAPSPHSRFESGGDVLASIWSAVAVDDNAPRPVPPAPLIDWSLLDVSSPDRVAPPSPPPCLPPQSDWAPPEPPDDWLAPDPRPPVDWEPPTPGDPPVPASDWSPPPPTEPDTGHSPTSAPLDAPAPRPAGVSAVRDTSPPRPPPSPVASWAPAGRGPETGRGTRVFRSPRAAAATAAAAAVLTVLVGVAARPSGGIDPADVQVGRPSTGAGAAAAAPTTTAVGGTAATTTSVAAGDQSVAQASPTADTGSAAATDVDSVAKAAVPASITVDGNTGLQDGGEVMIAVTADGSEIFGFEAFLCAGGEQFEQDADVRPTQTGKCVSKPLSDGTDRYKEARATPPNAAVEATFKVGAGTDSYTTTDGTPVTITCGADHPCQLVLKIQFTGGFGFRAYPLEYA